MAHLCQSPHHLKEALFDHVLPDRSIVILPVLRQVDQCHRSLDLHRGAAGACPPDQQLCTMFLHDLSPEVVIEAQHSKTP